MKTGILGLLLLGLSFSSHASFIASSSGKINPNSPTRILVVGIPEKLGSLFVYSALTKAKIFQESTKDDQIIIIGRDDDQNTVSRAGYKVVENGDGMLKESTVGSVLARVNYVKSLDVYAHSNAVNGILIDKSPFSTQFLEEKDPIWDVLKAKSKSSSYIFFQGCNAGVKLGPWVAKRTGITVLAALTGTDFQSIYNDSFWAHDYNGKKEMLSDTNVLSFESESQCSKGFCTRMKPDNSSYKGHWGDWSEGGYPTYKIFCGTSANKNCGPGAVEAIKTFPSTVAYNQIVSLEKFKEVTQDFLCPFGHNPEKQANCINELEASLVDSSSNYSPFRGTTLNCDMERCYANFKCGGFKASFAPGSCKLINEKPGKNSTFTNEYKFLINAYKAQIAHD
jgi:hypothetical protein